MNRNISRKMETAPTSMRHEPPGPQSVASNLVGTSNLLKTEGNESCSNFNDSYQYIME